MFPVHLSKDRCGDVAYGSVQAAFTGQWQHARTREYPRPASRLKRAISGHVRDSVVPVRRRQSLLQVVGLSAVSLASVCQRAEARQAPGDSMTPGLASPENDAPKCVACPPSAAAAPPGDCCSCTASSCSEMERWGPAFRQHSSSLATGGGAQGELCGHTHQTVTAWQWIE